MSSPDPLHLFSAVGIELEYMIVDDDSLSVRPVADALLKEVGGGDDIEVERGPAAWSNELALHVIEMKTNGPSPSLAGLGAMFQKQVSDMGEILGSMRARLLPTAMHPWMDPNTDLKLWPHENNTIYNAFDRIFNCKGHGWANLQSMHINLPFANDMEFASLHAAIRMVLPLLPGLAASSPFVEGRRTSFLDNRLDAYRFNAERIPSVTGRVIPEAIFTRREYEEGLLQSIYDDLSPHDPDRVLQHEWVNARGAIARFDRMAIEIRLLDVQECPQSDIAIAAAVMGAVRGLMEEHWCGAKEQKRWHERALSVLLFDAVERGDATVISNRDFIDCFGFPERGKVRLRDLWQHLFEAMLVRDPLYSEWQPALTAFLQGGCLARRISDAAGEQPTHRQLEDVYRRLADCLGRGQLFSA